MSQPEPPIASPRGLPTLPLVLVILSGALTLAAPSLEELTLWSVLPLRDAAWFAAGGLLVMNGVRALRSPAAPRAGWMSLASGAVLLAASLVMARVLHAELEVLLASSPELVEQLEERVADEQADAGERARWSVELARLRFRETGQTTDVLTGDGEQTPVIPDPGDREARAEIEAARTLQQRLEGVTGLVAGVLGAALLLGFVLKPHGRSGGAGATP